jgi:hypothetical protein
MIQHVFDKKIMVTIFIVRGEKYIEDITRGEQSFNSNDIFEK